jgi:hypothetical protein
MRELVVVGVEIKVDAVEVEGRGFEGVKFLGVIPVSIEKDDFNVYVRWVDNGSIRADRSDTDEMLVAQGVKGSKLAAFQDLMVSLATRYGADVVVSADFGVKLNATQAKMLGTYCPRESAETRPLKRSTLALGPEAVYAKSAVPGGPKLVEVPATVDPFEVSGEQCRVEGDGLSIRSAIRMIHANPCTCVREHEQNTPTGEILTLPCVFCDKPHDTLPELVAHQDECQRVWLGEEVAPVRTVAVFTEDMTAVVSVGDVIYQERTGHWGNVVDIHADGTISVRMVDGSTGRFLIGPMLMDGFEIIPRAEYDAGVEHTERVSTAHQAAGVALLSQPVRTLLNRRKRKASKVNRRKVKGGF